MQGIAQTAINLNRLLDSKGFEQDKEFRYKNGEKLKVTVVATYPVSDENAEDYLAGKVVEEKIEEGVNVQGFPFRKTTTKVFKIFQLEMEDDYKKIEESGFYWPAMGLVFIFFAYMIGRAFMHGNPTSKGSPLKEVSTANFIIMATVGLWFVIAAQQENTSDFISSLLVGVFAGMIVGIAINDLGVGGVVALIVAVVCLLLVENIPRVDPSPTVAHKSLGWICLMMCIAAVISCLIVWQKNRPINQE